MEIDKELLDQLAEASIEDYFEDIDSIVELIVNKLIETYDIEDDDDIKYLKDKIMRGILKFDSIQDSKKRELSPE